MVLCISCIRSYVHMLRTYMLHTCLSVFTGKTPLFSGVRLYDKQDPPLN